ncbi:hypothetical protein ABZ631_06895, partial [Nocardiopsis alba]|uniref:hypothetical protein n=1 Tax=Nocardiopsis alba TaxID=53437 RepID=UPI0033CF6A64
METILGICRTLTPSSSPNGPSAAPDAPGAWTGPPPSSGSWTWTPNGHRCWGSWVPRAELEEAMERHVASYTDEWAAVLADPEKLSRFV